MGTLDTVDVALLVSWAALLLVVGLSKKDKDSALPLLAIISVIVVVLAQAMDSMLLYLSAAVAMVTTVAIGVSDIGRS